MAACVTKSQVNSFTLLHPNFNRKLGNFKRVPDTFDGHQESEYERIGNMFSMFLFFE